MDNKSTNNVVTLECPTETAECFKFAQWCWLNHNTKGKLIHIPNEGRRSVQEGYKLKRMGLRPGTSDYFLAIPIHPYGGMWIEMKRRDQRKSRLSPLQSEFIQDMRDGGYYAVVTYGADEAIQLATQYLNNEL